MAPATSSPPSAPAGPLRRLARWIAGRPGALWARLRPERRTLRGISLASSLLTLAVGGYFGSRLRTGEGWLVDTGIGVSFGVVFLLAAALLLALVPGLVRLLSQTFGRFGLAALVTLFFILDEGGLPTDLALLAAAGGVLLSALLFGALAVVTSGRFGASAAAKQVWVTSCGLAGVAGVATTVVWSLGNGSDEHLRPAPVTVAAAAPSAQLTAADPSTPGPHAVETLTYGSGSDRHRPEYGAAVTLVTEPVNGRPFVDDPTGWRGRLREKFWGFDAGRLPLNGRVWYPAGAGPFPLVLVVHGNHYMAEWSDPGYAWLGELLASRGCIVVSVDENFLNSGGIAFGSVKSENDCRGWLLLEHLALWRRWHETEGHRFHGVVDLERIALIGHSRGGEAVYHAALFNRLGHYPDDASVRFDYGFAIQGIVSIAPSDGQYRPAGRYAELSGISFFTIQGGHDADVSSFVGDRMYRRVRCTQPHQFKASLYVHRANHGQFNTVWGDDDVGGPKALFLNRRAYVTGEEQRRIATVYFSAFVEVALRGVRDYVGLFRDHRAGRAWLPATPLVNRYEDSTFQLVADFEEDFDVTTTSLAGGRLAARGLVVWREGDVPLRGGGRRHDNAVFLGWKAEEDRAPAAAGGEVAAVEAAATAAPPATARFEIALPAQAAQQLGLDPRSALVLDLGASDAEPKARDYTGEGENGGKNEQKEQGEGEDGEEKGKKTEKEKDQPREPIDLTVELVTSDGITATTPLSRFGVVLPPLKSVFTRSRFTEEAYEPYEPVLQTFSLPLAAFAEASPDFRPEALATIRLVFDRTREGVLIVDRVGFAR